MQYDLDFLRRAYREEGAPISTDASIGRDDVMFTDSFIYGTSIIVNPFMAYELIFRDRPAEWLEQIRGRVAADAGFAAERAIERLERDGEEDRDLLFRARLRKTLYRLQVLRDERPEPPGTITP